MTRSSDRMYFTLDTLGIALPKPTDMIRELPCFTVENTASILLLRLTLLFIHRLGAEGVPRTSLRHQQKTVSALHFFATVCWHK